MNDIKMLKYFFDKDFKKYEELFLKYGVKRIFSSKEIISAQGDTLKYGFYIKKGIMQVSIGNEIGKEKTVAFIGEGGLFPIGINKHEYKMEYSMVERAFTDVIAYQLEYTTLRELIILKWQLMLLSIIVILLISCFMKLLVYHMTAHILKYVIFYIYFYAMDHIKII